MQHFVTEMCTRAHFCYKMVHCGIWDWFVMGYVKQVYYGPGGLRPFYKVYIRRYMINSMMTSSNGNIFRVTGHLCGEFTGHRWIPAQRPVTRSFDVFFDLRLNTRLSKQWWGWWFEAPSRPLWRHCNVVEALWRHVATWFLVNIGPGKTNDNKPSSEPMSDCQSDP